MDTREQDRLPLHWRSGRLGKRRVDLYREQDRHPLHWQVAAIGLGVWIVAVALVALAWGVLR